MVPMSKKNSMATLVFWLETTALADFQNLLKALKAKCLKTVKKYY